MPTHPSSAKPKWRAQRFRAMAEIDQKHARHFAAISYVTYGPNGIIAEQSYPKVSA
jgi:hypothetical protein